MYGHATSLKVQAGWVRLGKTFCSQNGGGTCATSRVDFTKDSHPFLVEILPRQTTQMSPDVGLPAEYKTQPLGNTREPLHLRLFGDRPDGPALAVWQSNRLFGDRQSAMRAFTLLALLFLSVFSAHAQDTGSYIGRVLDAEFGAFEEPGVEILLTGGNEIRSREPNPQGWFGFWNLPDGDYSIKVRKAGYQAPPARTFSVISGSSEPTRPTFLPPGEHPDAYRAFVMNELDPDVFRYHWEEDQSTAGYDYAAHVNEPYVVEFLGEPVDVLDDSSAIRLEREYGIILVDSDTGTWTQEHAYRLLETMKAIPRHYWIEGRSRWALTSAHVADDIWITGGSVHDDREVLIADEAFTYATPRTASIDEKRGQFFSRRLHHAGVRFVTDNGHHTSSYEKILRERYGVTTRVTDHTTYSALTSSTTEENSVRFQNFHAEEIVQIINMLEELPSGMRSTPGLEYLVRRKDGFPHPLYPNAPAVAWTDSGYIEFMDIAFLAAGSTHRLIIHEKAHFLWAHLFDDQLRADWIELGGWFETADSPSGWWTTKQTEFVSAYAHNVNPNEDMAESIAYFVINPDKLRSRAIGKYEFIRDRIMHGSFYISQIREDLTFEVYNLYPDYVFPGKIRRVDILVTGAPNEDKTVTIEVELHALDRTLEGAQYVFIRIESEDDTYTDKYLYPVDGARTGTVLGRTFTIEQACQVRLLDSDTGLYYR